MSPALPRSSTFARNLPTAGLPPSTRRCRTCARRWPGRQRQSVPTAELRRQLHRYRTTMTTTKDQFDEEDDGGDVENVFDRTWSAAERAEEDEKQNVEGKRSGALEVRERAIAFLQVSFLLIEIRRLKANAGMTCRGDDDRRRKQRRRRLRQQDDLSADHSRQENIISGRRKRDVSIILKHIVRKMTDS